MLRNPFDLIPPIISAEKNGKTLHLLKSSSKPGAASKKRKKIPIMGTFGQYKDSKSKAMAAAGSAGPAPMGAPPQISQPKPASHERSGGAGALSGGQSSILNFAGSNQANKDAKMSGK